MRTLRYNCFSAPILADNNKFFEYLLQVARSVILKTDWPIGHFKLIFMTTCRTTGER